MNPLKRTTDHDGETIEAPAKAMESRAGLSETQIFDLLFSAPAPWADLSGKSLNAPDSLALRKED